MKLIFKEIHIIDFKGFRDNIFKFNEKITNMYGENGTGKTSILDAIYFIFFNKNSLNQTKFDYAPLDLNNVEIPNTNTSIELKTELNGEELILKRDGSKYIINGVVKKASEYKKFIESLVSEKMFMTMINPVFFGDSYKWDKQKDIILSNFSIEDTIIQLDKYSDIKDEIELIGIDDLKSKYQLKISDLSKITIATSGKIEYILSQISNKKEDSTKEEMISKRNNINTNIEILEKSLLAIAPLNTELNKLLDSERAEKSKSQAKTSSLKNSLAMKQSKKTDLLSSHNSLKKEIKNITTKCSLCGSPLNESDVKKTKSELTDRLQEILTTGKTIADEIKLLKADILNSENESLKESSFSKRIKELKLEIDTINSNSDSKKISDLKTEASILNDGIASYDAILKLKQDLAQYKESYSKDINEKETNEILLSLAKEYHKEYSELVANKLNQKLKSIKINTFKIQKDGQIKETFEITKDGVPYSILNNAGKITAGIELINLLSELLDINIPIIIDNKESITRDFDVINQLITLSVKEGAVLGV